MSKTYIYLIFIISFLCEAINASAQKGKRKINTHNNVYSSKSIIIDKQHFVQVNKEDKFYCLISPHGDTIIQPETYHFKAKLIDINEDGIQDFRIFIFSNTANQCENYLYDKNLKTFKLIKDCDLDIKKIKGTSFYYSYNSSGCSDMNWESYLCRITNYELKNLGYIYGQGCDFDIKNNPQFIEIYKIVPKNFNKETIIP